MEQNGLKMYRFPDTKGWKIAFCIYFFAMLLVARDTMIAGAILTIEVAQFVSLGLMVLGGIVFLIVNREHLKEMLLDQRMIMVVVSTVVILFPMFVKRDWQLMYFSVLMCLYFALFLAYFLSFREASRIYVAMLVILGIYSIIATYIFQPLAENGLLQIPIISNSVGYKFYNFGLAFGFIWPEPIHRNWGIFREPGVYQFFVLIAVYLNNYISKWNKPWILWMNNLILSITMLTTFATGGVIELLLFVIILIIDKQYYKNKIVRRVLCTAIICIFILVLYSWAEQNTLFITIRTMILKIFDASPNTSGGARYDSIAVDTKIFFMNPFFGEKIATTLYAVQDNTTSTMILFAIFGVLGGLFHVAGWIALVWEKNRKIWINLALLLVLFMSFNTQNLIADVFFWLFPMMALIERGLPLLNLEKFRKKA